MSVGLYKYNYIKLETKYIGKFMYMPVWEGSFKDLTLYFLLLDV